MGTEAVIRTEQLVKTYGRNRGLDGLDLRVEPGEVYGFLGPNGAGKSTTIRILLDLIRPTSGQVRVLGADPRAGGAALRRRIGYLAGDFVVDGRQTGRELLTYLARLRGGVLTDGLEQDLIRCPPVRGARVTLLGAPPDPQLHIDLRVSETAPLPAVRDHVCAAVARFGETSGWRPSRLDITARFTAGD